MSTSTRRLLAAQWLRTDFPCLFSWFDSRLPDRRARWVAAIALALLTLTVQAQQRGGIDLFREDGAARLAANTSPVAA